MRLSDIATYHDSAKRELRAHTTDIVCPFLQSIHDMWHNYYIAICLNYQCHAVIHLYNYYIFR